MERITTYYYDAILESYQAEEMAEEHGISAEEAAIQWFTEIVMEEEWRRSDEATLYSEFISGISQLNADLYYCYGANYYFLKRTIINN